MTTTWAGNRAALLVDMPVFKPYHGRCETLGNLVTQRGQLAASLARAQARELFDRA